MRGWETMIHIQKEKWSDRQKRREENKLACPKAKYEKEEVGLAISNHPKRRKCLLY
jgi:hypothetical protein